MFKETAIDTEFHQHSKPLETSRNQSVALLTGGADKPYAFGLATALISCGSELDLIGSDELDFPEFHNTPGVTFLNLRGSQDGQADIRKKISRVLRYYAKLIRYAATAKPLIFHILWNNKIEWFDRTLLMLYYRLLGKRIVLTAHNVNAARRDGKDTAINRLTLRFQYRSAHHIFVHTQLMKREMMEEFGIDPNRISIIPFGINNAVPNTTLSSVAAREKLGLRPADRTILFFGNIAPYKGVACLIDAFRQLLRQHDQYRLVIAGRPKNCSEYWEPLRESIRNDVHVGRILLKAHFIPDEETEIYFKAADVLVLPYLQIYQSGVLFLGYSFGLPAIATDIGCFHEDIVEGETGFLCKPDDPVDLARAIERYFKSDLYRQLDERREEIRDYAAERHSWDVVANLTRQTYSALEKS